MYIKYFFKVLKSKESKHNFNYDYKIKLQNNFFKKAHTTYLVILVLTL